MVWAGYLLTTDRLDTATCTHTLLSTDVHIRTDHVRYTLRYLHCFSVVSCPHPSNSALNGILFLTLILYAPDLITLKQKDLRTSNQSTMPKCSRGESGSIGHRVISDKDLRLQFLLPSTSAYESTVLEHQRKKAEIWEEFYVTDAMAREDWKEANYLQRHLVTRFATHGFHFKICRNTSFHDPNEGCMCLLCDELCGRYHVMECKNRLVSLTKFCSSES
ncbi:hypothetical protein ANN_15049 [Periplaneta americana]|uniref:Uncharacterized protein n=1 Tax=Periplaneta americana TaxID=6978 RepID=A0ABQ8SXZ7_PERAM|nr:hypothetical protein ANN_15049 [Periplaneta americana]